MADDFYLWFALIRPLIVFARKFLFSLSTHDIQYFLSRHKSNEILKVQKIRAAKSIVENYTLSQKGYTRRQKLDDFMKYDTEMGLDHTCAKKTWLVFICLFTNRKCSDLLPLFHVKGDENMSYVFWGIKNAETLGRRFRHLSLRWKKISSHLELRFVSQW